MGFKIEAACGCNIGKIRKNNEDNFHFDGKCLKQENKGLRNVICYDGRLQTDDCVAVFDGMGGENYGEVASFVAARHLQRTQRELEDYFVQERTYLNKLVSEINDQVVREQKKYGTDRMGSTMVLLYFSSRSDTW